MLKKTILSMVILINNLFLVNTFAAAPSFSDVNSNDVWWYTISAVDSNSSLRDNIFALFFPSSWWSWGIIWNKLQTVFVWLLFIFIIWAWALFVLKSNDEWELKKSKMNLLYIVYWTFLVFGSVWILWTTLNVWWATTDASTTVIAAQNDIIWSILIFLKSAAYYIAIILIVYYGYKIMQAQEKEDKIKSARTWAINVILALIAIKVLDYIYFIAQEWTFGEDAGNFIASAWTVLGWVLWVIIILVLIYAWFLLITSRWDEEKFKKSKTLIRNVFLVVFVLFLFIVIVFDLVKNFS